MVKVSYRGKIIACLDMGSSKITCLIAGLDNDTIKILGYSHKDSRGIIGGAISDMKLAQKTIINTVSEAERMAGFNIERLLVGLSSSQVTSSRKEEHIKIASDMVKSIDISNLAAKIRTEFHKNNREMIHLIPLQYHIDDCSAVQNPRYMTGNKLFAKFHTISTSNTTIRNIENCLKGCQLSINNYVIEPYSAALSCLSEQDMANGTLLIDIGGDITSFCLINEGKLVYSGYIPIAGNHITKDIATVLNVSNFVAEKIKYLNNNLDISEHEKKELIHFKSSENEMLNSLKITRDELADVIKSRLEEIIENVKITIEKAGVPNFMINNIVVTGGSANIAGIENLVGEIFDRNAIIGYPTQLDEVPSELANPAWTVSLGMLVFLKNLYLKEKIKDGFETKNHWFKKIIESLVSV